MKERSLYAFFMALAGGPVLTELLEAQREEDVALEHPAMAGYAAALAAVCEELGSPIVWPVGSAAERLAGAAVVQSQGAVRLRGWNDDLSGERVLLLAGVALGTLGLHAIAEQARRLGALDIVAAGIRIEHAGSTGPISAIVQLSPTPRATAIQVAGSRGNADGRAQRSSVPSTLRVATRGRQVSST